MSTAPFLKEVPQPLDPRSPRRRKFTSRDASLLIFYDYPDGDHVNGFELILTDVPDERKAPRDIFISSDDYYRKFVICPAQRTPAGLVRGKNAGYMKLDKEEILRIFGLIAEGIERNITDFVVSRIRKYMY